MSHCTTMVEFSPGYTFIPHEVKALVYMMDEDHQMASVDDSPTSQGSAAWWYDQIVVKAVCAYGHFSINEYYILPHWELPDA